jgi:drug/metabolite transporter (DMT)-like permease
MRFKKENLLMLCATFFWAQGHPLGKIIVREVHPFALGSVTLMTGFLCMLLFCAVTKRISKIRQISRKHIFYSLAIGLLSFFIYQILTFSALQRIPASMNAILVATNVIFIMILARVFLKERIGIVRVAAIFLAMAGVVFVVFNTGLGLNGWVDLIGCSFSLGAAVSFALYSVFGKGVLEKNDPLIVVTLALLSGGVLLTALAFLSGTAATLFEASAGIWLLMVWLGVGMIGISYPIWFFCLKRLPASQVSIYIYTTPVFAVLLSLLILKERFFWPFWLGAALVLFGIVLANSKVERRAGRGMESKLLED